MKVDVRRDRALVTSATLRVRMKRWELYVWRWGSRWYAGRMPMADDMPEVEDVQAGLSVDAVSADETGEGRGGRHP